MFDGWLFVGVMMTVGRFYRGVRGCGDLVGDARVVSCVGGGVMSMCAWKSGPGGGGVVEGLDVT